MEELAIRYVMLDAVWQRTIDISCAAAGFVMALVVYRNRSWSIRRVPYFILTNATVLVVSITSFAAVLTYKAMAGGMLWMLTLLVLVVVASGGHVLGALAHARSVNGYGTGKAAWLGLIPLLSLVLLFIEPVERFETRWSGPIVNFLGTMLGIVLFLAASYVRTVGMTEVDYLAKLVATSSSLEPLRVKMLIVSQGLDATLAKDAATVKPHRIHSATTLKQVQATGTHLRYIYEFMGNLSGPYRETLTQSACSGSIRTYIEAGATIEHQILRPDDTQMDLIAISSASCKS